MCSNTINQVAVCTVHVSDFTHIMYRRFSKFDIVVEKTLLTHMFPVKSTANEIASSIIISIGTLGI